MGNDEPDATTAFEVMGANESDHQPGVQSSADSAPASTDGAELPPLITGDIDATPVRSRFVDGGQ